MGKNQAGRDSAGAAVHGNGPQEGADAVTATGAQTAETTEVHEMAGNQVVNFVKNILQEGNVNRIQVSRQNGEVLWGISLTAGIATTAVITLLLPALTGFGLIVLMISHMRVEVVRKAGVTTDTNQGAVIQEAAESQ